MLVITVKIGEAVMFGDTKKLTVTNKNRHEIGFSLTATDAPSKKGTIIRKRKRRSVAGLVLQHTELVTSSD